jgi:hypothetical protein
MKRWRRFCELALGLLRELAGESAYARHLKAHGRAPSAREWRRFSDEWLRRKYTHPKCC